MNRRSNLLTGLGVMALTLIVAAPPGLAQCPASREFGAYGSAPVTARIKIRTPFCPNDGNEYGAIWDALDPTTNSGGAFFGTPDLCPISTGLDGGPWWLTGGKFLGPDSGIQGFLSSHVCLMTYCPPRDAYLQVVVEDVSVDGADACTIVYLVDETPAQVRWYDLGRTVGGVAGTVGTHVMETFPYVDLVSQSGTPPNTTTTQNYRDVVINFHGVSEPGNTPLPASAGIRAYDVMVHHGPTDPGRLRSAWTLLKSIPYSDAAIIGDTVSVPCPTLVDDSYLAVGLEYAGGVKSVLVGRSLAVECDPNLADPIEPAKRPIFQRRGPLRRGR